MAATEYLVLARSGTLMTYAGTEKATSPRRAVDAVRERSMVAWPDGEQEVWIAVPVRNWSAFQFAVETREVVTEIGPPEVVVPLRTADDDPVEVPS